MRGTKILLGFLALVAVVAGGVYLFRLPLAGMAVRAGLSAAGLENPQARVTALSLDEIALAEVAAGPEGREVLRVDAAEASYDWRDLLFERRVETLRAGPGLVRLVVSPDGRVSIPGVGGGEGEAGAPLPFSALEINDIALSVDTPDGAATGAVSATYDVDGAGAARLRLETERAGTETLIFENAALAFDVDFAADGAVTAEGAVAGDVFSAHGSLVGLDVAVDAAGRSWKDVAAGNRERFTGEARIDLKSASAPVADAPALARVGRDRAALIFGAPVSSLGATGTLTLALTKDGVSASVDEAPLRLAADNGATLAIDSLNGAPVYRRSAGATAAAFSFAVDGALVSLAGTLDAQSEGEGWRVVAPVRIGEYRSDAVSLDESSAVFRVETRKGGASADVTTSALIRRLSAGRFNVLEAPVSARFLIDADTAAGRANVSLPDDACLSLDRARVTHDEQDMDASLSAAKLCGDGKPLAVVRWAGDPYTDFSGVLKTDEAKYRIGETRFAGRPPMIDFSGTRDAAGRVDIAGAITDGAVVLNDALVFSAADGRFAIALDGAFEGSARFDSIRIAQNDETPLVAPVLASGEATLKGKNASFNYAARTPEGARLGVGKGFHDIEASQGRATFNLVRLAFAPDGVQPDALAPVLKGLVGEATGAATGSGWFAWGAAGATSGAEFTFEDVTFAGPTRVVTQTVGLDGDIQLANLWPVTTRGVQTITVERVDLDNLQLGAGSIAFEMPGDETVRVDEAAFPWFGGTIGVYDASLSFAGGQSTAPLRADNIDLKLILEFVDVDGLSGEGVLSGVLPLVIEDGRAHIRDGVLRSQGPGALRYTGEAASQAAAAGEQVRIAFDLLRDLRYETAEVTIDGPLDGRLDFQVRFEGTGPVALEGASGRVPVIYRISLDAALLDLLNQANLTRDIDLQIERALQGREEE